MELSTHQSRRWNHGSSSSCKGKGKRERDGRSAVARRWAPVVEQQHDIEGSSLSVTHAETNIASGRIVWLLDYRCVEFSWPHGRVRTMSLPVDIKSGSRAVQDPACSDALFVLENGSSRLWHLRLDCDNVPAKEITNFSQSSRFRSSLGSRLLHSGPGLQSLVVTGTPGRGACDLWCFDLRSLMWTQLPPAPHAILSSAAFFAGEVLTIVGGWSKESGCHGHLQKLSLQEATSWSVASADCIPWRRPGAGAFVNGKILLASGWMECEGIIGSSNFRLLRRNGAAQRARTSSSFLCEIADMDSWRFVDRLPLADSFEHNGELYQMGHHLVCVGRDHIQMFDMLASSWQTFRPPLQLQDDSSSSWAKHCGSWALAFMSAR